MDGAFRSARGGRVKVRLGAADRNVLAGLLEAVADLLEAEPPAGAGLSGGARGAEPPAGSDADSLGADT